MKENVLGRIKKLLDDLPVEMYGVLCDLLEKLVCKSKYEWLARLKKFLRNEYLFSKPISNSYALIIDPTDGKRTLKDMQEIIFQRVSLDTAHWENRPSRPTPATLVTVHAHTHDATFVQMFGELSADVRKLCFTLPQVEGFINKYEDWLVQIGYGTFFLLEANNHLYVAQVKILCGCRRLIIHDFSWLNIWEKVYPHRLVVPKLDA